MMLVCRQVNPILTFEQHHLGQLTFTPQRIDPSLYDAFLRLLLEPQIESRQQKHMKQKLPIPLYATYYVTITA